MCGPEAERRKSLYSQQTHYAGRLADKDAGIAAKSRGGYGTSTVFPQKKDRQIDKAHKICAAAVLGTDSDPDPSNDGEKSPERKHGLPVALSGSVADNDKEDKTEEDSNQDSTGGIRPARAECQTADLI